jgi:hypothetical protein
MEGAMRTRDATVGTFRAYLNTEWHRLPNLWPIAVISLGAIISFGWVVLLLWLMWGLLNLAL